MRIDEPLRRVELRTWKVGPTTICVKQPGQVGLLKSQFFNAQYTAISGISSTKGNSDVVSNIPPPTLSVVHSLHTDSSFFTYRYIVK